MLINAAQVRSFFATPRRVKTSVLATIVLCGFVQPASAQVFINELHYDNSGADTGEAIEVAGPAGTDLSSWSIVLYNGNGGALYNTISLSGTIADQENGFGTLAFPISGIQNGSPDGIALVNGSTVIQFLSYEGSFTAVGGPANGMVSIDIGVTEPSSTPAGFSLQLTGSGTTAAEFLWAPAQAHTFGAINAGQSFVPGGGPPTPPSFVFNEIHADPASGLGGDANGDGTRDFSSDEFVELANTSSSDVDISNWTLSDGFGVRHSFPPGSVVQGNCAVVVFGGNTPVGSFGDALVQIASSGTLGLNNGGDTVTLSDGMGGSASAGYGSEGGNNQSLTLDPDVTGTPPWVQHTVASGSGGTLYSPGTLIDGSQFSGCDVLPPEPPVPLLKIHEVQGSGLVSPEVGNTVAIEGIVVGDFQDGASGLNGDLNGFFVQEEDADVDGDVLTSEGIFVFDGSSPAADVAIGDAVRVEGPVSEFFGMTRITSFTGVSILSSANPSPSTTIGTLPVTSVDDFEAFEGMLVTFPQSLFISEYFNFDRFNETVLTSERHLQPTAEFEPGAAAIQAAEDFLLDKITLDDGRSNQNPNPAIHPNGLDFDLTNLFRGGDAVQNATGVLNYSFNLYRIQPTQGANYASNNPRTIQPDPVGGNLKVASFNVLNYFTTLDDSGSICGPSQNLGCRGADNATEFTRQRDKIIAALTDIDADVVGLIEIENNIDDDAVQDLIGGLNAANGAGTYDYVSTDTIGTDAIKVALIYKPASVALVGGHAILDSSVDGRFIDFKNRPTLAQTFMDSSIGGVFTVAVNHFKSKGSSCVDVSDPDTGDGSGNCNLTRKGAAEALVDWLAGDPTGGGSDNYLILGDLNSYDKEEPIDVILAGGYTDLIYAFRGEDAYSFVFDGQTGYLDYALSSDSLTDHVTGVTAWHINADEPDLIDYDTSFKGPDQEAIYAQDAYRSSDHDPVIVGLDVCEGVAPSFDVVSVTPNVLWPANHKYVDIEATVVVSDNFDPTPSVSLVSVTSNEPDNGPGDGNTVNDIVIEDDFQFMLRAERAGSGSGRIYTITYLGTDSCGNTATATTTVTVPHSKGR